MSKYIKRRKKAFIDAFRGILEFFKKEAHAQLHGMIFLFVVLMGFYFEISQMEWISVLLASALVFTAEIINSAIENWLDKFHPEYDETVGKVKDIAAGAVLVASIMAAIVGLIIFVPHFL